MTRNSVPEGSRAVLRWPDDPCCPTCRRLWSVARDGAAALLGPALVQVIQQAGGRIIRVDRTIGRPPTPWGHASQHVLAVAAVVRCLGKVGEVSAAAHDALFASPFFGALVHPLLRAAGAKRSDLPVWIFHILLAMRRALRAGTLPVVDTKSSLAARRAWRRFRRYDPMAALEVLHPEEAARLRNASTERLSTAQATAQAHAQRHRPGRGLAASVARAAEEEFARRQRAPSLPRREREAVEAEITEALARGVEPRVRAVLEEELARLRADPTGGRAPLGPVVTLLPGELWYPRRDGEPRIFVSAEIVSPPALTAPSSGDESHRGAASISPRRQ